VAEALVARRSPTSACAVVGSSLAADGVSLGEALSALAATHTALSLGEPTFSAAEALSLAWSEATLAFVNDISCEDPLTGLASGAHLRARLCEVYREAMLFGSSPRLTHALLVVDLAEAGEEQGAARDPFEQALCLAGTAEVIREAFPGGETLARIGSDKVVALVHREADLGRTVAVLRDAVVAARVATRPRLWIEGLPDDGDLAMMVVAGLALL
jgi:GGDEF domain-containing protein